MAYLDWHVGMKVVCVDAADVRPEFRPIEKGRVYTIRAVVRHPERDEIGVYLLGVENSIHPRMRIELGYIAGRFRPVQTRKTDISQFQAMLHDQRQKVDA